MHDVCAVMALIHPEVFKIEDMYVEVETKGVYCVGQTVGDIKHITGKKPNTKALMDVNRRQFIDLMISYIRSYSEVR